MISPRLTGHAGFTLVEMLVAVAIAGIVGMAAITVFTSTTRTTTAQTDLTDAQQNVRAAMDRLSQHVRAAGFGLPERATFSLTFGANTFTRPVSVTNSATGPDSLDLVGIGREAGILGDYNQSASGCNMPATTCLWLDSNSDFKKDGTFNALSRYISLGGAAFLEVSGIDGDNKIILTEPLANLSVDFFNITPRPSVFILQALRYTIATNLENCSTVQPCLAVQDFSVSINRNVLAQGIEDLQIGVFISPPDTSGGGPATFSNNGSTSSPNLSALRINLVGKARNADRTSTFTRPALEDRAESAPDSFRRRVMTSVVKIRNPRPSS